jgi:hypothetical protein
MSKRQHTPASAAVGIEHAIRMLEGRWKHTNSEVHPKVSFPAIDLEAQKDDGSTTSFVVDDFKIIVE